jgi:hypothetical protein
MAVLRTGWSKMNSKSKILYIKKMQSEEVQKQKENIL